MKRDTKHEEQVWYNLHCEFWAHGEMHNVKELDAGPWKFISEQIACRPSDRPYTCGLSGTSLYSDPTDVRTALNVIGSADWRAPDHE